MIALTQTIALIAEAYRELNAKKLFWVALGLNALFIAIFGGLGINESGTTFFHWTFDYPFLRSPLISPELFYKLQFTSWGITFLSWFSIILALISTAAMIPDLITGGSIETLLSKPIGRARLLLTKFATGLLFVALQVSVFCVGCFLVIWIRGNSFTPSLFLAIPIVVLVFSYLFSVCVLLGLLTRSTIASLLLVFVFWGVVFVVNSGDKIVTGFAIDAELQVEKAETNIEKQRDLSDRLIAGYEARGEPIADAEGVEITDLEDRRLAVNIAMRPSLTNLKEKTENAANWRPWSKRIKLIKAVFPKTQETTALLKRSLISDEDLTKLMPFSDSGPGDANSRPFEDPRVAQRIEEDIRDRSLFWVLGTSLIFEGVVLSLALLIFSRRDF